MEQTRNAPPRYTLRLEDLRAWHVVVASCPACGSRIRIPTALLERGRPPHTKLLDLQWKLRCRSCGNREGNTLTIAMAPRD